jgi:hypothetical protein
MILRSFSGFLIAQKPEKSKINAKIRKYTSFQSPNDKKISSSRLFLRRVNNSFCTGSDGGGVVGHVGKKIAQKFACRNSSRVRTLYIEGLFPYSRGRK